jgi:hypothetical protein
LVIINGVFKIYCCFGVCSCPAAAAAGLAQVHGVLQSNTDSLKSMLVFVNPMAEQSTKAIIEVELTVELLLSGADMRFEVCKVLALVSLSW